MKTKLLKIVRERYIITKYTKVDNINHHLYGHTVPVWEIKDNYDDYSVRTKIADSEQEAYEKLIKMIRHDYAGKMNRTNRQKSEKVWYKP